MSFVSQFTPPTASQHSVTLINEIEFVKDRRVPLPSGIKAAAIDFDGTLFCTKDLHLSCWRAAVQQLFDVSFESKSAWQEFYFSCANWGGAVEQTVANIHQRLGGSDNQAITAENLVENVLTHYPQVIAQDPPPFIAGAPELLEHLKEQGLPMIICTNGNEQVIDRILTHYNIGHYFQDRLFGDDLHTSMKKPNPGCYLQCAERLGVYPEQLLVMEDATSGVAAAWRAGAQVIAAVPTHLEHLFKDQATAFTHSRPVNISPAPVLALADNWLALDF